MRSPLALLVLLPACQAAVEPAAESAPADVATPDGPIFAHLGRDGGDRVGFREIEAAFAARNPGYALEWDGAVARILHPQRHGGGRIVFVQTVRGRPGPAGEPETTATLTGKDGETDARSPAAVGDIVLLRPGEQVDFAETAGVLVFTVPAPLPAELPWIVRPDWDPRITDTPGGCATETGAYRRILLTWLRQTGPYDLHALNAHRVRIMDSFTHYHPVDGGFDELYLVQRVMPTAQLLTSARTADIIDPDAIHDAGDARSLLRIDSLAVGDLVYLPRGTVHRGRGGVLAQVITVPGFVPGAEIGVDHHLRAIAERFGLTRDELPYNVSASAEAVVR